MIIIRTINGAATILTFETVELEEEMRGLINNAMENEDEHKITFFYDKSIIKDIL